MADANDRPRLGTLLAEARGHRLHEDAEHGEDAPPIIVTRSGRVIQSDFECADRDTFFDLVEDGDLDR